MRQAILFFGVAIAGLLGVCIRFLVNFWHAELRGIILSTFLVNSIGSYFIGLLWQLWQKGKLSHEWYIILTGGFLGGLTTFSGYALNLMFLTGFVAHENNKSPNCHVLSLVLYALLMPLFGMFLVFLGMYSAR